MFDKCTSMNLTLTESKASLMAMLVCVNAAGLIIIKSSSLEHSCILDTIFPSSFD